ncbi:thiamine pyrophosphate protein TPP binding domain protein [Anaeromyxobacter dehalogenans 2CP-1]|uniref:Thiamine pyrophosphate protein TPP binding domain protein n=1 Tax=Anaeromyxobacter dehalogenans (strain ATCC BAA-258 / DSM 21875 / 2CP-1) TaxID=455488 RepID=B8JF69_ANAD2|nr:thiamine pyrophosphate-binding protein [Anaeromyxobacter dehalogenans]ACL64426.1 thiamine pyrophosphate protein TPP binding domain protein [Anaeromyxobacter dehalogenans 2CP-1]
MAEATNGGAVIAAALQRAGVGHLFTLCGGHISPILVECKRRGLRVVDARDEANAVFAADAMARLTGRPGVAAVTAGPGVTNAVTALENARLAQSPVVLLGGATATLLRGRGALQDIDQLALMRPIAKWATRVTTVGGLRPTLERALALARGGVPGPVFVEVPVDLLYDEALVRDLYRRESGADRVSGVAGTALRLYLEAHLARQFRAPALPSLEDLPARIAERIDLRRGTSGRVERIAERLSRAERPVLILGSQALAGCEDPERLAAAVRALGVPVYLGGMARGLLGRRDALQFRHARGRALKEADVVVVAGFPFDFRLGYGRGFGRGAFIAAANLSAAELRKNRSPDVAVEMHPGELLVALAAKAGKPQARDAWFGALREREAARDREIAAGAEATGELVNPLRFLLRLEEKMAEDAALVVDGGDFVATAAYTLRPRAPLAWLDPGVFGTLGVGGGFATAAALARPGREVWLLYGDGSCAYSLAEFDTFARHGLAPIAVIGNDGSWQQIAREQVDMLGDDVGTVLSRCDYHRVAEGYGGVGLLLTEDAGIDETLDRAREAARAGRPVCINVHLRRSEFRKGSISM